MVTALFSLAKIDAGIVKSTSTPTTTATTGGNIFGTNGDVNNNKKIPGEVSVGGARFVVVQLSITATMSRARFAMVHIVQVFSYSAGIFI